ncbi:MAG TPA: sugar ABC transporter permease [Candidatus Eisenbergiella stercoravium]|nr:sugar ABC transporter permease [Candidatus Eisenbergiella stercoravium]
MKTRKDRRMAEQTKTGKRKKKFTIVPYLFIAPNFIGFLIFILLPVLVSLVVAFTDFNIFKGLEGSKFVGIKNFTDMFNDVWFRAALKNNVIYTLGTIPALICGSIVLAAVLNDKVFCKTVLRVMIFIPYISSVVAVSSVWILILNPSQGILNNLLRSIGITDPPGWLGDPHWALAAMIIIGIWLGLGYNTIIYMSGLQSVPQDLYEAARIDGASGIQIFFRVTVPMLQNTTFFLLITNIISSFQVFGQINIMTNGGPGTATTVLAHYIYRAGFSYHKMGYASAMAWFLLMIIFLVTVFQWKFQKKHEDDM